MNEPVLTPAQLARFERDAFLVLPGCPWSASHPRR